ncbi:MAG: DUF1735 domain-containing protein [Bacteroidetes bacterium]|nr:DUF1735 domain-containing protein [Bacteroidota bacterium]
MKKSYIALSLLSLVLLASCLKDKSNVEFNNLGYIAEISTASTNGTDQAPSGGLAYFTGAVIPTSVASGSDDNFFTVNIASPYPPTKDVPVTLAINDAARTAYNAASSDGYIYDALPTAAYSFPATTGTVRAGYRLDTFNLSFFHDKMDPTKDYMLPISITQAPGTTISGNMSTIYFHIIGNLLAVNLKQDYSEWLAPADTSGAPTATMPTVTTLMTPLSPTKVEAASLHTNGTAKLRYDLSFVRSGSSLGTFTVAFKSGDTTAMRKVGDTVLAGPSLLKADFANGVYQLGYQIGTAAGRKYIVDKFSK